MLSELEGRVFTTLSSLRTALSAELRLPLPPALSRESWIERHRALSLLVALDGTGAPSLDAFHWLGASEPIAPHAGLLVVLLEREPPLPLSLLRDTWLRWRERFNLYPQSRNIEILAMLGLLSRSGGEGEALSAMAELSAGALDVLIAHLWFPESRELLPGSRVEVLYAHWVEKGPAHGVAGRPSFWEAVLATLHRDPSRRWFLEGEIDGGRLQHHLESLPPDRVASFFEGYPERWSEALERLWLPVEVLMQNLDARVWEGRLREACVQELAAQRAQRESFEDFCAHEGDTVQIRVLARVRGGFIVHVAVPAREGRAAHRLRAFLPGSQHAEHGPVPEDFIGAQSLAVVREIFRPRATVVVSQRDGSEAHGEPQILDPELSALLEQADPHVCAPFALHRAHALIEEWDALAALREELRCAGALPRFEPRERKVPAPPAPRAPLEDIATAVACFEALYASWRAGPYRDEHVYRVQEEALLLAETGHPSVLPVLLRVAVQSGSHVLEGVWSTLHRCYPG